MESILKLLAQHLGTPESPSAVFRITEEDMGIGTSEIYPFTHIIPTGLGVLLVRATEKELLISSSALKESAVFSAKVFPFLSASIALLSIYGETAKLSLKAFPPDSEQAFLFCKHIGDCLDFRIEMAREQERLSRTRFSRV